MIMGVKAFRVLVVLLAVAVAAVPVVLDGCILACQQPASSAGQRGSKTEAACHHTGAGGPVQRIRGESKPCGHDHRATGSLAAAAGLDNPSRSLAAPDGLVTTALGSLPSGASFHSRHAIPPPRPAPFSSSVLPLRI